MKANFVLCKQCGCLGAKKRVGRLNEQAALTTGVFLCKKVCGQAEQAGCAHVAATAATAGKQLLPLQFVLCKYGGVFLCEWACRLAEQAGCAYATATAATAGEASISFMVKASCASIIVFLMREDRLASGLSKEQHRKLQRTEGTWFILSRCLVIRQAEQRLGGCRSIVFFKLWLEMARTALPVSLLYHWRPFVSNDGAYILSIGQAGQ